MLAYLDASRFCSCICGDCVLCENAATRERRRIVLIKITTQLRAHWETWNKAEIACLFSACRLNSSKFPMSSSLLFVHILHLSSSLSHSLSCFFCCCFFSYPPPLCPNCYLTFKASFLFTSFLFTLLNNWNSSLFQNHTRNPESFLTQTLRRIRLSNSRKRKHCGWRGGVCQVLSRGSLIVPRQRLDCWYIRSPSLLSSCHRTAMKAHGRFSRWINERISTIFVQLFFLFV